MPDLPANISNHVHSSFEPERQLTSLEGELEEDALLQTSTRLATSASEAQVVPRIEGADDGLVLPAARAAAAASPRTTDLKECAVRASADSKQVASKEEAATTATSKDAST